MDLTLDFRIRSEVPVATECLLTGHPPKQAQEQS
jgi:hypothetical protein